MARKPHKGKFRPLNPQKYRGDPTNIIYRSGLELKVMLEFDRNKSVISWSSEEVIIPYISPLDNRQHRYFMDFYVEKLNASDGKLEKVLIEVKPEAQTKPPMIQETKTRKPSKRYIHEVSTWAVNQAKWNSAVKYAEKRGWSFIIMTEKDIGYL
jgi:hypothetical protein